ncbi:MAG: DNA recombination protein RmuC [Spirochaetales bacterium]|nr:DNA recombination protein RmuC [Spirochaetales bacterium]
MLVTLIILSSIIVVLLLAVIALLIKKGGDNGNSEDVISHVTKESESVEKSLDSAVKKILDEERENRGTFSTGLNAINTANREQMNIFYEKLSKFEDKVNARQIDMLNSMNMSFKDISDSNIKAFKEISDKTEKLTLQIRTDMDKIRTENNQKLDEMRKTVDEKLQQTLEERISKAFKEVTENLSKLYASLGSLNALTEDVKNINKIFSNVKARGVWGEVQAETILSDILTPDQYEKDYSPSGKKERVEFAIRLPGKEGMGDVYLPIDSKFPTTDYVKYKESIESKDETQIAASLKMLKERVISEARDINKKYILPPETTDFAILFLPAESIYAELLRMEGLVERLQSEFRVILTGPNNFAALLNSLSLGFRTLQIEQYTSKIWKNFEVLKKYFADLSKAIDESKKAVDKASDSLDSASKKKDKLSTVLVSMESTADKISFANAEFIESD